MNTAQTSLLSTLRTGEPATVVSVDATDEALRHRLIALGFAPGTPVVAVRRAPMGDPTEYDIRGARIALRRTEAAQITVTEATP